MTEFSDDVGFNIPHRRQVFIDGKEVIVRLTPNKIGTVKITARSKDGLRLNGIYTHTKGEKQKIDGVDFRNSSSFEKIIDLHDFGLTQEVIEQGSYQASMTIQACKAGCYSIIFKIAQPV